MNSEEVLKIFGIVRNNQPFSYEYLRAADVNQTLIQEFVEWIKEKQIVIVNYWYDCEITNETDMIKEIEGNCVYCNERISNTGHIIREMYTIKEDIINEYIDIKEEIFNEFVPTEYKLNFKKLKENLSSVVPFIGSGVSIPLGLPNWIGLIELMKEGLTEDDRSQFQSYLDSGDVFSALDILKNESLTYSNETIIKSFIGDYIEKNLRTDLSDEYHNINDILSLNSDFYITTNYDNALSIYKKKFLSPVVLNDIEDMQSLLSKKNQRIIHLHGNTERPNSMVVTEKDYNNIYQDEKNARILSGIMSSRSFLFIGFSFNDKYFTDLYRILKEQLGGNHYIILGDLHPHKAKQLIAQGLIPISINVNEYKKDQKYANQFNNEYTQRFVNSLKFLITNLLD